VDAQSRKTYNTRIVKVSTKGRYGLRTLIDIAMHNGVGAATLNELARRQDISVKYLWQVINPLKAAGILGVARGARGGYFLIRRPEDITMLEIVTALEGELQVSDCLDKKKPCPKSGTCVARAVWQEVNNAVKDTLQNITLAELIRRCAVSAPPTITLFESAGRR